MKKIYFLIFLLVFLFPSTQSYAGGSAAKLLINRGLPSATLEINRGNKVGNVSFEVEIAKTVEHRQIGLMNVVEMTDKYGMLFVFKTEKKLNFWMKNTFIPLDIVYINSQNKIVSIAKNTTPQSLKAISSKYPAQYALEINAGLCDRLNINLGDEVIIHADSAIVH